MDPEFRLRRNVRRFACTICGRCFPRMVLNYRGYRPAIAAHGAKVQNTNNVDDVRTSFLARFDRSLQRHLCAGDDAGASPVWAGLGPQVVKCKREVSVSHGYTSFSL